MIAIKLNFKDYLVTASEDKSVKIMPLEKILNDKPSIEYQIDENFIV